MEQTRLRRLGVGTGPGGWSASTTGAGEEDGPIPVDSRA